MGLAMTSQVSMAAENNPNDENDKKKIALLQIENLPELTKQNIDSVSNEGIFVGSIAISGSVLKTQDFTLVIEANIGQEFQEEDFSRITQEIADLARNKGYIFATARIPEQDVNLGILNVEVDEGQIDAVTIDGSDNEALAKLLNSVIGRNITKKELERVIILANDIPKIRVNKTRFITEDGQNILEVNVKDQKNRISLSADNYGTQNFGPTRVLLAVNYSGLFNDSDQGNVSVSTNPVDPEEFVFANAAYSIALNKQGTRVGIAVSAGKNDRNSNNFGNIDGDSRYVEVFASHPLIRSDDASLWINTSAAFLEITQDDSLGFIRADTQVTYTAGLSSNIKLFGGRLRTGTSITQGLDILGTTRLNDPLSSRFDGDGVFTKGAFYANWSGRLHGGLGFFAGVNGQITNRPLLASQEFTIGGAFSVRGYDFAELSGENAVAGLLELNYTQNKVTPWLDRLQPYIFFDGGYVDNLQSDFGDGSLFSTGLGLRGTLGRFNFEAEGAFPLSRIRFESQDRSPHINLRVGLDI